MAKVKTRIGLDLYVFKEQDGHAPACVISAHGFYRANDPNYDPPANVQLHFFCAHGAVVADIGNVGQANVARPPYTVIRGAPVTDYILSKYQAHGAEIAEAEAMVRRSQPDTAAADVRGSALGLVAFGGNEAYEHLEALDRPHYDVVTIRNRSWMNRPKVPKGTAAELMPSGEVRLSWVIDKIQGYHRYNTYYCLFCRELKALTGEAE